MGKRLASWVLAFPKAILAIGLLLTLGAGFGTTRIVVNNDLKDVVAKDNPVRIALEQLEDVFGSSETVVIKISHPQRAVFEADFLRDLRKFTTRLKRMKGVSQVQSLATADRFSRDDEGGLVIEKVLADNPETDEEAAAIREVVMADPDIRKAFLSEDNRSAAIYVDPKPSITDEELLAGIREVVEKALPGYQIAVTGLAPVRAATNEMIYADLLLLMPVVSLVLIGLLWMSLRNIGGVLLTLTLITLSIIPAAGVMGLIGIPISSQTTTFPVLILAIVCGDSIHILSTYYKRLKSGTDKLQAIEEVVKELSLPVFLTSATSAAGFLGMLSSPLPPMGGLGVVVAVGIMWAWLLSTLVLPAALVLLPTPKLRAKESGMRLQPVLEGIVAATTRHAKLSMGVVGLLIGFFAAIGIPLLEREVSAEKIFQPDHWVRQDSDAIDAAFRSSAPLEMLVEGDVQDPALMQKIADFAARVDAIPEVGSVDSVATIVARIQDTLTGSPGIPQERERLAQTLLLYSISGSPDRYQRLVSTDGKDIRVTIRMPNLETERLHDVLEEIKQIRDEELAGVKTILAGKAIMMDELSRLVLQSAILSIGLALAMVFVITAFSFSSFVGGVDAMAPLTIAIVGVFGAMGLAGVPLTIASALITSIVIGVGVDFGIHFLARWNLLAGLEPRRRLGETVHEVGAPILMNAFTVAGGLAVLSISKFEPIRQLGLMAVFAMLAAAFGALIILPLMKTFRSKSKETSDDQVPAV